jgi:hypothetical protein
MVILFKPYHTAKILTGTKTQTRRLWGRCHVKVGGIYQARTRLFDKSSTFARLKVLAIWPERLFDISEADAREEGYDDRDEFLDAFGDINDDCPEPNPVVWAVKFEVYEVVRG